jgi:parallel beta-helix repeat protein
VLPVPTNIANGATVNLECGKTYQGTLQLNGKSNVTVTTSGTCGKATISPGNAITGWTKYSGNIYSAAVGFTPVQVAISGAPVSSAHWPNSGWSTSAPPNSDLSGGKLVYKDNQSVIKSQTISGSSVSTSKPFYVEGKLWMLDQANEWAYSNGRVYVWTADGQSPEGRAWASPDANAINADKSSGITVNNIRIFAAANGISADTSTGLKVLNTDIANTEKDGIWASGSQKMTVDSSSVTNARGNGIDGWYSVTGATVTNTTVANTGNANQPTATDAGIFFGDGSGNRIENVRVTNSGYHGISVLHNSNTNVLNSVVDGACVTLTDCAGIYTGARDQKPLGLTISGNTVSNVKGTEGIGIYLDDFANGVTVTGNTMRNNTRAMTLHNAFDNVIQKNTFDSSAVTHLSFGQDSGNIRNNKVTGNTFKTTGTEWTYNMETGSNLKTFASFDGNTYTSVDPNNFGRTWDGKSNGVTTSFTAWKAWVGGDKTSTMNGKM